MVRLENTEFKARWKQNIWRRLGVSWPSDSKSMLKDSKRPHVPALTSR